MNNEINQTATDMNNMASDTQQAGTGIGQSSPNIDLNASKEEWAENTTSSGKWLSDPDRTKEINEQNEKLIEERKERERTHGDIMADIQKYESEIDQINEMQELLKSGDYWGAMKIAGKLDIDIDGKAPTWLASLGNGKKLAEHATQYDPRKTELMNLIKQLKEHNNFDNRTDEQRRSDKLLEDQRDREDSAAQRGTQDMLKAGLHPASANYGGSIGGSSGGGGGGSGSESEKEKERRRKRKRQLEKMKREKQKELLNLLGRMGAAGTYGAMRNTAFKSKNMNNNNKVDIDRPNWLDEEKERILKGW